MLLGSMLFCIWFLGKWRMVKLNLYLFKTRLRCPMLRLKQFHNRLCNVLTCLFYLARQLTVQMMQNPQILAALQERLDGLVGTPTGYIERYSVLLLWFIYGGVSPVNWKSLLRQAGQLVFYLSGGTSWSLPDWPCLITELAGSSVSSWWLHS